jgi:PAS domain S-box-containing protein
MRADSSVEAGSTRAGSASDAGQLLQRLTPLLTQQSLDTALPGAIQLIGSMSGAAAAGILLLRKEDVAKEHWHGDESVSGGLRAECIKSARLARTDRAGSVRIVDGEVGRYYLWTTPLQVSGAEPIGAITLAFSQAPGRDTTFDAGGVERLADLFAAKIVLSRETAAYRSEKERYERWFRTLDSQLQVLDRERQKFVAVASQSDTHMIVVNTEYRVRWVNQTRAGRLDDVGREVSWIDRPLQEVWDTLEVNGPPCGSEQCPVAQAFATNVVVHEEYQQPTATERRNLYVTAMPIKAPDGHPDEVLVMVQDVSDLEVLRRSETRYRQLFEQSPDAMIMVEPTSGCVLIANPVAEDLTGYEPKGIPGLSVEALHEPADWPNAQKVYDQVFLQDDPIVTECILKTADGSRIVANMAATRFELEGQAVVLVEFQDITDRKQLESELRHSQKMDAIGRLAGGVAHDFNNILTIILGQTELMLGRLGEGNRLRRTAESIEKAAVRGSLLTRQLLAFSRKEVVKREIVDLCATFSGIEPMLRTLIGEDVELVTSTDPEPCFVRADRGQIEQVIMNLVVNARDAMPHGGKLSIGISRVRKALRGSDGRARESAPCALLRIHDTGTGMDSSTQARLFEPFFTTKAPGEGTGLGLSSAYGIVQEAAGEISVMSEPGEGTTFLIHFPLQKGVTIPKKQEKKPSGVFRRGHESILLVEDEEEVRAIAMEALRMSGYSVLAASSGDEALDLLIQYAPVVHLILTDVIMPGLSGGELVQRIAAVRPQARVLYMSGYNDDAIVRHGVSDSNAAFIQKPFTLEGLTSRVREILDRPQSPAGSE